jgi:FkbM family methyltransferase
MPTNAADGRSYVRDRLARSHITDLNPALRGWAALQRARIAHRRHPDLGEISAYCFYATKLRFGQLAFDIGANHGEHTARMLGRGARVVAVEPQAQLAAELAEHFQTATVLRLAVSDEPGNGLLHRVRENDGGASLDWAWADHLSGTREGSERVTVTTLDILIAEYGEPTVVKIDTEGFDHCVLRGLSRPIEHVLFEVHAARPDAATEAFARLDDLAHYEYYAAPLSSWLFLHQQPPDQIIAELDSFTPAVGDVYARRVD